MIRFGLIGGSGEPTGHPEEIAGLFRFVGWGLVAGLPILLLTRWLASVLY